MQKIDIENSFEYLIVGGGIVGLCIAYQLIKRGFSKNIAILEKEPSLGLHTSGRNSGVMHAGLYYKPNTLKADVCVSGAKRLINWITERNLPINRCGKIIVPTKPELDSQLDVLAERGRANGAVVEIIDSAQLKELEPEVKTASKRAIWSPNTAVIKPKEVISQLQKELEEMGVKFFFSEKILKANKKKKSVFTNKNNNFNYNYFINCSGLESDKISHLFDIGKKYKIIPFRGSYWEIKNNSNLKLKTNIYPVPDLNVPFLGVHFTPSADKIPKITIGPTATIAFGRENYNWQKNIEPISTLDNILTLTSQYVQNRGGFRKYVHEQAFLALPHLLIKSAKELVPKIKTEHIIISKKVGIRAQLFNKDSMQLENDFIILEENSSFHILNTISPAFTSSFSFADHIINFMKEK